MENWMLDSIAYSEFSKKVFFIIKKYHLISSVIWESVITQCSHFFSFRTGVGDLERCAPRSSRSIFVAVSVFVVPPIVCIFRFG